MQITDIRIRKINMDSKMKAVVSVTFDNTSEEGRLNSPYDEITVTRRYFRVGESEYLINKKPVRLRDIYELFMNTGVGMKVVLSITSKWTRQVTDPLKK